jgi:hypothetical protein
MTRAALALALTLAACAPTETPTFRSAVDAAVAAAMGAE